MLGTAVFGEHLEYQGQGAGSTVGPPPPEPSRRNYLRIHMRHYVG